MTAWLKTFGMVTCLLLVLIGGHSGALAKRIKVNSPEGEKVWRCLMLSNKNWKVANNGKGGYDLHIEIKDKVTGLGRWSDGYQTNGLKIDEKKKGEIVYYVVTFYDVTLDYGFILDRWYEVPIIVVVEPCEVSNSGAPSVTSFTPARGAVGTTVTIAGLNFTGATQAKFKNTSAQFTVVDNQTIQTTVPAGAKSGPITVVNPAGQAKSGATFTVTP